MGLTDNQHCKNVQSTSDGQQSACCQCSLGTAVNQLQHQLMVCRCNGGTHLHTCRKAGCTSVRPSLAVALARAPCAQHESVIWHSLHMWRLRAYSVVVQPQRANQARSTCEQLVVTVHFLARQLSCFASPLGNGQSYGTVPASPC